MKLPYLLLGILLLVLTSFPSRVQSVTDHIVISEVQIGGTTATDEFVELYNPTSQNIDLAGWRLSRKNSSGTLANLVTTMSGTIPAHGFFLIAPAGYDGLPASNLVYSTGSSIAADFTVLLYSDAGITLVDKVGAGSSTDVETTATSNPATNGSMERKAIATSSNVTMSTGGIDEFSGNGEDTDNNATDFVLQTVSNPQNSTSLTESLPTPSSTTTPTLTPSPTVTPSETPTPTPEPTLTPTITPTPTNVPSLTPTATPTQTPTLTPTPTPNPSPTPRLFVSCNVTYQTLTTKWLTINIPRIHCELVRR